MCKKQSKWRENLEKEIRINQKESFIPCAKGKTAVEMMTDYQKFKKYGCHIVFVILCRVFLTAEKARDYASLGSHVPENVQERDIDAAQKFLSGDFFLVIIFR